MRQLHLCARYNISPVLAPQVACAQSNTPTRRLIGWCSAVTCPTVVQRCGVLVLCSNMILWSIIGFWRQRNYQNPPPVKFMMADSDKIENYEIAIT